VGDKHGLLLGNRCYVLYESAEIQQRTAVSWFKAVSHCASVGLSLASIGFDSLASLSQLANYLSQSGQDGQPLWIGLSRRPWVWVQSFDAGIDYHSVVHRG